jgi:hypothetical protein
MYESARHVAILTPASLGAKDSMMSRRTPRLRFHRLAPTRGVCTPAHLLLALVVFVAVVVQVSHPAIHPLELINPDANAAYNCPVGHATPALLISLPLLSLLVILVLGRAFDPGLQLVQVYFNYRLLPRPPPILPL